jgi:hypothetical protein
LSKILFVPTGSREVAQFSLVKTELEKQNVRVIAIALDRSKETLLKEKGFVYKHLANYKTLNMLNIIKEEKPDMVVTDYTEFFTCAFTIAANYMGLPSLRIDDGIVVYNPALGDITRRQSILKIMRGMITRPAIVRASMRPGLFFLSTLMATNTPVQFLRKVVEEILKFTQSGTYREGANVAVLGQSAKDVHIARGAPPENIFVTGQPRFDLMFSKKFNKERFLSQLGIPQNKGIVVLATQQLVPMLWSKDERKAFIKTIAQAMGTFPDEQLVIKLHPAEHISDYQHLLKEIGCDNAILCQNVDLYELLNACNLLMTVFSTVAVEAMLFNKPVICIEFTGRRSISYYTDDGAAIGVHREEDLVPAMHKALYNLKVREKLEQNRKRFLSKSVYKPDGQTSKRVTDLITQMIEKSKKSGKK